jgi:glycosyltransferase involved in cell wall biosynthesis
VPIKKLTVTVTVTVPRTPIETTSLKKICFISPLFLKGCNRKEMKLLLARSFFILLIIQLDFILLQVSIQGVEGLFQRSSGKSGTDHELAWHAPFYSGGGYCSEARSFIQALVKVGYTNLTVHQHGDSWNENYIAGQNLEENILIRQYDDTYKQNGSALINICHSEPGAWYVPTPRYRTFPCPDCSSKNGDPCFKIGRTMFETDSIPDGWVPRLNYMDEVWVPTKESKEIFEKAGVSPSKLRVVAETVDTDFYSPITNYQPLLKKKKYNLQKYKELLSINFDETFIFLFIGKFEQRKGIDLLIQSYYEEFSSNDNVLLLLLTSAYHSSSNFDNQIEEIIFKKGLHQLRNHSSENPPYLILTDIHQDAMPVLYSLADVLVMCDFFYFLIYFDIIF